GEVDRLAAAIAAVRCRALLTLSVLGRVELAPADPLDAALGAAFDAHQRRVVSGRRLLGPDAPAAAEAALRRHGLAVAVQPSPWRLGPHRAELTAEWLRGWVAAAVEQQPDLGEPATSYLRRRLADIAAGRLHAVVGHHDLLAG
ncbi:MAG TPA: SAM-dependent methyltransferase, partial [Actinoplanes sp.]|nr:SAM-dependent methyltransferase [Actinoplanes sp.]